MKTDVRNFLNAEVGKKEIVEVEFGRIDLDDRAVLENLGGGVELINLGDRILAKFDIKAVFKLQCDRCQKKFIRKENLIFEREYAFFDEEEVLKIKPDLSIDLYEPIREEAIINLPMKFVCEKSCEGIKKQPIYPPDIRKTKSLRAGEF